MSQKTETVTSCSGCFNYFRSLRKTFFQYGQRFPNNKHLKEKKQIWLPFSFFLNGNLHMFSKYHLNNQEWNRILWHYRKSVSLVQASVHLAELFLDPAFKFKSVFVRFWTEWNHRKKDIRFSNYLLSWKETRSEIKVQHSLIFLKMQSDI